MEKLSFIMYLDMKEMFDLLPDEEAGMLIKSVFDFAATGEVPEGLSTAGKVAFSVIRAQLTRDMAKWETERARRSEAGKKGGRPRKSTEKESKAKKADNVNVNVNENVDVNENENVNVNDNVNSDVNVKRENKGALRFSPPTAEQVREYCQERRNRVDPEKFVNFYAAKGWRIGSTPMYDWKAAVRTWETRKEDNSGSTGSSRDAPVYEWKHVIA